MAWPCLARLLAKGPSLSTDMAASSAAFGRLTTRASASVPSFSLPSSAFALLPGFPLGFLCSPENSPSLRRLELSFLLGSAPRFPACLGGSIFVASLGAFSSFVAFPSSLSALALASCPRAGLPLPWLSPWGTFIPLHQKMPHGRPWIVSHPSFAHRPFQVRCSAAQDTLLYSRADLGDLASLPFHGISSGCDRILRRGELRAPP